MTSPEPVIGPQCAEPDGPVAGDGRWFRALRGPLRYLPAALGVAIIAVASTAILQITHPFLSHDDWDSILPATPSRTKLLFERQLAEGRWLNYVWWRAGSSHLTPVTATMIYFGAYAAFVIRLAQRLAAGWLGLVVSAALFVSPMVAEAAYWPAILGPSMVVLAVATWVLPHCRHQTWKLLVWMSVATLLAMLTYQPVAMLIFLILMLEERRRPLRQQTGLALAFCVAWASSVLITFTINWFAYGYFGLQAQAWRKPNDLEGFDDLLQNVATVGRHVSIIADSTPVAIVIGIVALAACLIAPSLRPSGVLLLLATVLMGVLESLSTIQGGFMTPYRSSMWVWVIIVVSVLWLSELPVRRAGSLALGGLSVVIVVGSVYWATSVADHQRRLDVFDAMSWRVGQLMADPEDARKVIIVGSQDDWKYYMFTQQAAYLRSRIAFESGTAPRYCRPRSCSLAQDPAVIGEQSNVFVLDDWVVVRPPVSEWAS